MWSIDFAISTVGKFAKYSCIECFLTVKVYFLPINPSAPISAYCIFIILQSDTLLMNIRGLDKLYPCQNDSVSGNENLSQDFSVDGKIGFVVDAIYTAAHALHNMINHYCPNKVSVSLSSWKTCIRFLRVSRPYCRHLMIIFQNYLQGKNSMRSWKVPHHLLMNK